MSQPVPAAVLQDRGFAPVANMQRAVVDQNPPGRNLMSRARTTAIAVCAAMAAIPSQLSASSCNHPIVVPTKFKPNAHCWEHRGIGTHFFGQFLKGQTISIGAAGGTKHMTAGDFSWSMNDPWQIYIEGPGGFSRPTEFNGVLYAKLPAGGKYVISVGPCAIWGARGTVVVCASDPRLTIE